MSQWAIVRYMPGYLPSSDAITGNDDTAAFDNPADLLAYLERVALEFAELVRDEYARAYDDRFGYTECSAARNALCSCAYCADEQTLEALASYGVADIAHELARTGEYAITLSAPNNGYGETWTIMRAES